MATDSSTEFNPMHPANPVPEGWTEEMRTYLNKLRLSGATNMLGAGEYLERKFNVTRSVGRECLTYWMTTFTSEDE